MNREFQEKDLVLATHNLGKIEEFKHLFGEVDFNINNIGQYSWEPPEESGMSFWENSLIKAKNFSLKTKMVCLADDSGLEIDLLNKKPGIYSARWGGPKGDFNFAIKKVFKALDKKKKNWRDEKISARFICALTIFGLRKKPIFSVGKIEGYISYEQRGLKGFGYDPIFIPKGKRKTFGEMDPKKKYKMDHRFNAFKKIKKFL